MKYLMKNLKKWIRDTIISWTCYMLRSEVNGNLSFPKFRLATDKQSLAYSGVMICNSIPSDIRLSESVDTFKIKYRQFVLDKSCQN